MGSTHSGTTGAAYSKCQWVSGSGVQTPSHPVQLVGWLTTAGNSIIERPGAGRCQILQSVRAARSCTGGVCHGRGTPRAGGRDRSRPEDGGSADDWRTGEAGAEGIVRKRQRMVGDGGV